MARPSDWWPSTSTNLVALLLLQFPSRRASTRRLAIRSGPRRNHKCSLRMSLRSLEDAVVAAKHLLQHGLGLQPFRARFTLPEQHKSLATHTAMALGISVCLFAQNLHRFHLGQLAVPNHTSYISDFPLSLKIPHPVNAAAHPGQPAIPIWFKPNGYPLEPRRVRKSDHVSDRSST